MGILGVGRSGGRLDGGILGVGSNGGRVDGGRCTFTCFCNCRMMEVE